MVTTTATAASEREALPRAGVLLAVLGVVYGDIGTSPLYALKASLQFFQGITISSVEILGILSLIFWSLILIVTIKYVTLVMHADNRGEGGILALMALAQRVSVGTGIRNFLGLVGIAGACLFFGDGVITPAISVLSAVEGLEVSAPSLQAIRAPDQPDGDRAAVRHAVSRHPQRGPRVRPRHGGVVRRHRRAGLGRDRAAPVRIARHLADLCPRAGHEIQGLAFIVLGAVVLCVTGAEALYADMGHFGPRPIRLTWTFFVLPCLVLNYFGQGALLIATPRRSTTRSSCWLRPGYGCRWWCWRPSPR